MRELIAALALAGMACGGAEQAGQTQGGAPPAAAPAAAPAAGAMGRVHDVRMELRDGVYRYDPATLTIKVGDTVRWLNVNGFPHNVSFYQDQVPAGAVDFLGTAMANQLSPLIGPLMADSLATYEITFAGAPTGTYNYFCLPHEALGMKARLTVQP